MARTRSNWPSHGARLPARPVVVAPAVSVVDDLRARVQDIETTPMLPIKAASSPEDGTPRINYSSRRRVWRGNDPDHGMRTVAFRDDEPPEGELVDGSLVQWNSARGVFEAVPAARLAEFAGKDGRDGVDGLPGAKGADGKSAYEIARDGGYGGTQTQWLASLKGADGLSAYQIARAGGYGGTETQWLASLKGAQGPAGLGTVSVSTPARVFGAAFQPNKDKAVLVSYSVKTQVTNPLLVGTSTATVRLLSDASNPPTTERARGEATSGVGVTVTIAMTTSNTSTLTYLVPAGHWVLLAQSGAGTFTNTLVTQVEEALG